MLAWVAQFTVSCRRGAYLRGLAALQSATARAAASFERLLERGAEFELYSHELLYPAFSDAELHHLMRVATELRQAGSGFRMARVGADEMLARERSLNRSVVGGLLAGGERRVRPESFVAGVRDRVESLGATVIEHCKVTTVTRRGSEWVVAGGSGEGCADRVVLANGVGAAGVLRKLGVRLPLAAAKGYSRTFARTASGPTTPVYLEAPKVAISVYADAVRISGTLELGARTLALSSRRLGAITAAARAAMPGWTMPPDAVDWAGMRSLSPDGMPYIGAVPGLDELYVATGHATLGITLAPLTGELLAQLILDREADSLHAAFDPARAARPARVSAKA